MERWAYGVEPRVGIYHMHIAFNFSTQNNYSFIRAEENCQTCSQNAMRLSMNDGDKRQFNNSN